MAQNKRPTFPKLITPKLSFVFPKLSEPDYGTKEYPNPDGAYSLKGRGRAEDPAIKSFLTQLQPLYRAALAAGQEEFKTLKIETRKKLQKVTENDLFTTCYDKESEEPTGEIEFKFAMAASGEYRNGPKAGQRWNRKPDIFDARGVPMVKVPPIWGGTVGKVSVEARPYFIKGTGAAGLKLALLGVQIIDLVSAGGQRNAASHGFGAEDGYSYQEPIEGPEDETSTDSEGGDDEGRYAPPAEPEDF